MSDIKIVAEVVGTKDVNNLVDKTVRLENQVKKLSKAYQSGKIVENQYKAGLMELRKSNQGLYSSYHKTFEVVSKLSREYQRAKVAMDAEKRATEEAKAARQEQLRLDREFSRARREATQVNNRMIEDEKRATLAAKRHADEIERLSMKYRPLYAASKQYERMLDEINLAHSKGVLSTKQHQMAVDSLNAEYQQFQAGNAGWSNQFVANSSKAGRSANRMGMATQQAGYQVGDFIVQVQSGTNPFVAFGQQATQLVGVMGMMNPALIGVGAALGIIIPLVTAFGAAFYTSHKKSKEAAEGLTDLESRLKSLDSTLQDWVRTKKAAELGIGLDELLGIRGVEDAARDLEEAQAKLQEIVDKQAASSILGGGRIRGSSTAAEELEDATQKLIVAEVRLQQVRQKAADERRAAFNEELVSLRDQTELQRLSIRYGRESVQVLKEESDQRKDAYARQVSTLDLSDKMLLTLVRQNNELEDITLSQDAIARGTEAANTLWESLRKLVSDAADEAGRFSDNLVLGIGYTTAAVKSGVASGAIPPQALGDLPQTEADKAMQRILEKRRADARRPVRSSSGGSGGGATQEDPIVKLREQLDLQDALVGKTEAQRQVIQALGIDYRRYGDVAIDGLLEQIEAHQKLVEQQEQVQSVADNIQKSMSDAFMGMVDGTKSASDAFKDMARSIIKQLYDILVVQQLVGSFDVGTGQGSGLVGAIMKGIGGLTTANANGNIYANGNVQPFANGGIVSAPTYFPMRNGNTGLMGEAGPEAIMPLKRGKGGKLGVAVDKGSQQPVVVNQTFTFQANGDESVRRIIANAMPEIQNATTKSILDQRQRGGVMKSTFG